MKDERVYLLQIQDCILKIEEFISGHDRASFSKDQKTQSAVILQLLLIGELSKHLSEKIRNEIPLPWKDIIGFRDRAIHDYFNVDLDIVWETVTRDIFEVKEQIERYFISTKI